MGMPVRLLTYTAMFVLVKLRSAQHTSAGYGLNTTGSSAVDQGASTILSYAVDAAAFRTRHGGDLISPPKGPRAPTQAERFTGVVSALAGVLCLQVKRLSARCAARQPSSLYSQCVLSAWHRPLIGAISRPVARTSPIRLSLHS